jgi:hypothetical protein
VPSIESVDGHAGLRPRTRLLVLLVLLAAALCVVAPGGAQAATLSASPSTLSSVFASAQAGDTIALASGNYGTFAGGAKSGMVTLRPQAGATASMSPNFNGATFIRLDGLTINGIDVGGRSHDISLINSSVTSSSTVDASTMVNANIVFDNDTFYNIDACDTCYEGRLTVRGNNNTAPVGVSIVNSHFGNAGGSDGVQIVGDAYGVKIGPGNEFSGIKQGSYAAHVDSIQLYGSSHTQIVGNSFHDDDTIIMAPDGGDQEYIADNVMVGGGYVPAVQLGSHNATQFVHNTVKNIDVFMDSKSGGTPSKNGVLRDNVMVNAGFMLTNGSGCSACTISYNLYNTAGEASGTNAITASPVFSGGSAPATYAGYALTTSSPGKSNASDGTDRGIATDGSTPSPPPPPPPPPPADTTPPDTTISSGPTGTTSDATPSFAFSATEPGSAFECKVDTGGWSACSSPYTTAMLSDGSHTVAVRATDAAGNVDASPATRSFTVATAPAPDTTAPDTTITSGPTGATNDTTPSFAFTASESGSTFQCKVDAAAWKTCTTPYTSTALTDGGHTFAVRATDKAGNTDASAATRTLTVDTQAPASSITAAPVVVSFGDSATVAFTAGDPAAAFECRLDGGAWTPCVSPATFTGLTLGSHVVAVRATDKAGNVEAPGASASWVTVALPGTPPAGAPGGVTPPGTTVPPVPVPPTTTPEASAPTLALLRPQTGSTFTSKLNAAATAADPDGISRVEFWIDGTRIATDRRAPYTTGWSARSLSWGAHTLTVRAFDTRGAASSAAVSVTRVRSHATSAESRLRSSKAVPQSWRVSSLSVAGGSTRLDGTSTAGDTMTVTYTRCGDATGRASGTQKVRSDAGGHVTTTLPASGACVLKVA